MKSLGFVVLVLAVLACGSYYRVQSTKVDDPVETIVNDTIHIANDSLEYEIIIIDPGFNSWVNSTARTRYYYNQSYLEHRNRWYVNEWNMRVKNPYRYNPDLYQTTIDYDADTDYGYEVNYLLYNYFIYFQWRYHQPFRGLPFFTGKIN